MAFWKQFLVSLAVLAIIGAAWYVNFPGAQDVLMRFGIVPAATQSADGLAGGAGRSGFGGARTTEVVVRAAGTGIINDKLTALGSGSALHAVTLTPSAAGTLTEVTVVSGAKVKAGDVIARLDAQSQQIAYDRAKLTLTDAQTTLDRTRQLAAARTVSETTVQSAELAVRTAELGVSSAELDLRNRTIIAPIDGTIGIIQVDAGNAVTTQTVIATIEDRSALLVSFWVPERLMGAVKPGSVVTAVPVARPQDQVTGTIAAVDNTVDPASGTFEVQARIPNPDDDLRAGMSFTVSMSFAGDSFTAIDPLAIQWGSDGAYVWRIVDDKAVRSAIRIVQRNSENVLVAGDVAAGDAVITEGLDGLRDGQAVGIAGATPTETGNREAGARPAAGS